MGHRCRWTPTTAEPGPVLSLAHLDGPPVHPACPDTARALSIRVIPTELGVTPSTISREIKYPFEQPHHADEADLPDGQCVVDRVQARLGTP